jgi:hypothetical protein
MTPENIFVELKRKIRENKKENIGICECCGETAPISVRIFEKHHISGKDFSNEKTLLCLNCHRAQQIDQNYVFSYKNSPHRLNSIERILYVAYCHASLQKKMADSITRQIERYLEESQWKSKQLESTQKRSIRQNKKSL